MPNPTFNTGYDYFGIVSALSNKVKVKSSAENRSKQSANGPNSYGDTAVLDTYGETYAPNAEYDVVDGITSVGLALGALCNSDSTAQTASGIGKPIVLNSVTISTSTGQAPSISLSGTAVQSGATELRTLNLAGINLTARHRAQDFLGLMNIKKNVTNNGTTSAQSASAVQDYGLQSVSATFAAEVSLAQPKGEVLNYDIHFTQMTCEFTLNWYSSDPPNISLVTTGESDPNWKKHMVMTTPESKSCPEGGYTQYTWQVSAPLYGPTDPQPAQSLSSPAPASSGSGEGGDGER